MWVLALGLWACVEPASSERSEPLPGDVPAPAQLAVHGPDPIVIGRPTAIRVVGNLGQQEPVFLFAGVRRGPGPCTRVLGGACLDIVQPGLVDSARYRGGGADLEITVPATVPVGAPIYLQAVVVRGPGGRSSLLSTPVELTTTSSASVNPPGSVLIPSSDFLDPSPPVGWTQCAGFDNTVDDDVAANVLDNCLNTTRMRVRWWDPQGNLVEDVYDEALNPVVAWPGFDYLGGGPMFRPVATEWTGTTSFFVCTGGDACNFQGINAGFSLGNGYATQPNVSPADFDPAAELRISCGGPTRVGYRVGVYR